MFTEFTYVYVLPGLNELSHGISSFDPAYVALQFI